MNTRILHTLLSLFLLTSACDVVDSITGNDDESQVVLFPVAIEGSWGYINSEGAIVIEPAFQIAGDFADGRAAVRNNWRWEYIDKTGEAVIEGNFQQLQLFSEGKAAVRMDGRWGFVNTKGEFVINPRFRNALSFSDGFAFVRSLDYQDYLYIDTKGNPLESLTMPDLDPILDATFNDGRALVLDNNRYGYIDKSGDLIVDLIYSEALSFSEGLAAVFVSDRWGYIDTSGKMSISPGFISAGHFMNGLAPARRNSNQYGFINKKGEFVIPVSFDEIRSFSDERAAVRIGNKWTFVDKEGQTITDAKFDQVNEFKNGLARVILLVPGAEAPEQLLGYINKSGDYVWFPTN